MKKLTESQEKHIKEKLIKFQNELIRKNKIKKDNDIYNVRVLKILDICSMKMKIMMEMKTE